MARPAYVVYRVESMTGTTFSEDDVPERLIFVGACEALNSDAARTIVMEDDSAPCVVLRINTLEQGAMKASA